MSTGRDAINRVLTPEDPSPHEVVTMASLDDVFGPDDRRSVRLIKIDVEGFEEQVLEGAGNLLAAVEPVLIVEANDAAALRDILEPLGYRSYAYDPTRRQLEEINWLDIRDNNILALRNRSVVDERLASVTMPLRGLDPR